MVSAPRTISVGQGAALVFQGPGFPDEGIPKWVSSWGAVDVGPGDPAPNIEPGVPEGWTPNEADAVTPQASLNAYQSCRQCDLSGVTYNGGELNTPGGWSFAGDVSGANLSGAHMGGGGNAIYSLWNFDNANLTGAQLNGAFFDLTTLNGTIVDGTDFDGSVFVGTHFSGLHYNVAPSFKGVGVGNGSFSTGGVACTVFQDTSLLGVTFTLKQSNDPECASQPLFSGSTVPAPFVGNLAGKAVDLGQAQYVSSGGQALAGANLQGVDLDGSSFVGSPVDLESAHLDGASLSGTNFRLADLSGATLTDVTAPRAVFADADLSGATFAAGGNGADLVASRRQFRAHESQRHQFSVGGHFACGV